MKITIFTAVKYCSILHGHVCVMKLDLGTAYVCLSVCLSVFLEIRRLFDNKPSIFDGKLDFFMFLTHYRECVLFKMSCRTLTIMQETSSFAFSFFGVVFLLFFGYNTIKYNTIILLVCSFLVTFVITFVIVMNC